MEDVPECQGVFPAGNRYQEGSCLVGPEAFHGPSDGRAEEVQEALWTEIGVMGWERDRRAPATSGAFCFGREDGCG